SSGFRSLFLRLGGGFVGLGIGASLGVFRLLLDGSLGIGGLLLDAVTLLFASGKSQRGRSGESKRIIEFHDGVLSLRVFDWSDLNQFPPEGWTGGSGKSMPVCHASDSKGASPAPLNEVTRRPGVSWRAPGHDLAAGGNSAPAHFASSFSSREL